MKNLSISIILSLFFSPAFTQITYLHCGNLIDGISNTIQKEMTIIINENKIQNVVKGYQIPPSTALLINLKDKTVLPGLMDMHVHIENEMHSKRFEEKLSKNDTDIALKATTYCERTLMAGFTTVRDLGGTGVNVALKKAIANDYIVGPRIYTTEKSIATTGGHADPTCGHNRKYIGDPGPKQGVINGADEARKAVRQRYKNGADCIKITATGGVLSIAKDGSGPQFTMEELKAIVETANDYGMTTAAHAHGAEGMKRAVIAGITSIEHGTKMTPEVMELMKKHGTYYVPTITAGKYVAEKAKEEGFYAPIVVPKALEIGPMIHNTFGKAYNAGVKIAFGTDAGVFPHGENAKEFIYMTQKGMPPMEAIQSATIVPAEMLRINDEYGSIEKGKIADIIAVSDNPLENIETLLDVKFVMKDGKTYKK